MVIIIALIVLFAIFFVFRKHIGPALLAVIAGLSINQMFGGSLTYFLHDHVITSASIDLIANCVYLLLVLIFPLILYVRSHGSWLFGLLRIGSAALYAVLLTTLIAGPLAYFFSFDSLATQILDWLNPYQNYIILVGVILAYFDLLFYHESA